MLHLSLSLMNRLHKTESAVFELWMLYFQRISSADLSEITTSVVVPCGSRKNFPRTSIKCCYIKVSWSFGTGIHNHFERRVALNPGLGGVRVNCVSSGQLKQLELQVKVTRSLWLLEEYVKDINYARFHTAITGADKHTYSLQTNRCSTIHKIFVNVHQLARR